MLSSNEWDHGWTEEKKTVKTDLQSDVQTEEGLRVRMSAVIRF